MEEETEESSISSSSIVISTEPTASMPYSRLLSEIIAYARRVSPLMIKNDNIALCSSNNNNNTQMLTDSWNTMNRLVSRLTVSDFGCSSSSSIESSTISSNNRRRSPCYYIAIDESHLFTASIFGLRHANSIIPLHDHPGIHGLLKVLEGTIRIRSYTLDDDQLSHSDHSSHYRARLCTDCILSSKDNAIAFDPLYGNLHSIESIGNGSAAFFDLLMPCYMPPNRDCHYYRIISPVDIVDRTVIWLERTHVPDNYSCDNLIISR